MVEINLIRQRYVVPIQRRERLFFFIGIFLPILLFSFGILGVVHSVNNTVISNYASRIEKQESALKEEQQKAITPTEDEKSLQGELKNLIAFQEQHVLLTPKLVVIADTIPNRFYLNKINFEGNSVFLEGQGLPGNQTTSALAVFLDKLNGNENFIRGFNEMRLENTREEEGVLNFRIVGAKK